VLGRKIWARILGVERLAVIEGLEFDVGMNAIIGNIRVRVADENRCGVCGHRCSGYDKGDGRRRWRTLDLGPFPAYLEADAPRVCCPEHGVVVAEVPWARHKARHTRVFDDMAAWLTRQMSKTAVCELLRISWRTVGTIVERVVSDAVAAMPDRFADVRRIGIDEISYRKGHKYLTVVYDHDRGVMLWAGEGKRAATLNQFFDLLTDKQRRSIKHVTLDGTGTYKSVVHARCPNAKVGMDPFHVVKWATDAIDQVRREIWNDARKAKDKDLAKRIKGSRFVLWKGRPNLTVRQAARLSEIAKLNGPLYRAYLLKEQLREVFQSTGEAAKALLDKWLSWACRSRIDSMVELSRRIRRHRAAIDVTLDYGLSNGPVESLNTKLRLIIRRGFGFHSAGAIIALAMLSFGGFCPPLPHA